jgi:hypothetical protein
MNFVPQPQSDENINDGLQIFNTQGRGVVQEGLPDITKKTARLTQYGLLTDGTKLQFIIA